MSRASAAAVRELVSGPGGDTPILTSHPFGMVYFHGHYNDFRTPLRRSGDQSAGTASHVFRAWIQGVEAVPFSDAGVLAQLGANRECKQRAAKHAEQTEAQSTFVATTEPSEPPGVIPGEKTLPAHRGGHTEGPT